MGSVRLPMVSTYQTLPRLRIRYGIIVLLSSALSLAIISIHRKSTAFFTTTMSVILIDQDDNAIIKV